MDVQSPSAVKEPYYWLTDPKSPAGKILLEFNSYVYPYAVLPEYRHKTPRECVEALISQARIEEIHDRGHLKRYLKFLVVKVHPSLEGVYTGETAQEVADRLNICCDI